ncbi:hypothetical protein JHK82_044743 [Glycine max]|nr:hypothetical protein JHK85_045710 [Glycine max]KAG5099691.1 hypothetical protein JHK82_044743 [Glycine max]
MHADADFFCLPAEKLVFDKSNVHLCGLPQIVESWNRPEDANPQPSQFARSLTKCFNLIQMGVSVTLAKAYGGISSSIFGSIFVVLETSTASCISKAL